MRKYFQLLDFIYRVLYSISALDVASRQYMRPVHLVVQDAGFSVLSEGFDSPTGCHHFTKRLYKTTYKPLTPLKTVQILSFYLLFAH